MEDALGAERYHDIPRRQLLADEERAMAVFRAVILRQVLSELHVEVVEVFKYIWICKASFSSFEDVRWERDLRSCEMRSALTPASFSSPRNQWTYVTGMAWNTISLVR